MVKQILGMNQSRVRFSPLAQAPAREFIRKKRKATQMALDTRVLNLASAEEFVNRTRNVRWEGWDIVTFVPQPRAYVMPNGRFNRESGKWGLEYRSTPDRNGNWTVTVRKPFRK